MNRGAKPLPENDTDPRKKGYIQHENWILFSKNGKFLGRIPIPEDMVINCCFGGPDLKILYVTGGKTLWKIQCKGPGRVVWPQP